MRVSISTSTFGEYSKIPLQMLEQKGFEVILNPFGRKLQVAESVKLLDGVSALIAGTEDLTREVLEKASSLKVISRCGVGYDNVDLEAAKERGIKVLWVGDGPTQAVAELTLGLILDLLRGISMTDRLIKDGKWEKYMGSHLAGKTMGVLGLGRIGKRLVEITSRFGLRYLAWDTNPDKSFAAMNNVEFVQLHEVLAEADIITVHLPFSRELKGFIGEKEMLCLKKEAIILNTSRGGLVDENALFNALMEKRIAGAALDVFEEEPYKGPLLGLDNVILTSHIGSYAREVRVDMERQAVINLLSGLGYEDKISLP